MVCYGIFWSGQFTDQIVFHQESMIVMGSCFHALSGLRILKNTHTIWLVILQHLSRFPQSVHRLMQLKNTIRMFYTRKTIFVVIYHCNSSVVDMNKIQIKSIMNKYREWTCRIHYKGNDSHS